LKHGFYELAIDTDGLERAESSLKIETDRGLCERLARFSAISTPRSVGPSGS
jgi:hypothetical protein